LEKSSGESLGLSYHFFSDWQRCRRAFYWRRVAGYEGPQRDALLIGSALHSVIAAFRRHEDYKTVLADAFMAMHFIDDETRRRAFLKVSSWMASWVARYGIAEATDTASVETLVEEPLEVRLDFGALSGTPDFVIIGPDEITIEDIKSSNYKREFDIAQSETLSDQYAHYAFLVRNLFGINPKIRINAAYLQPDIPQAFVSDPFYISIEAQEAYIEGLVTLHAEIAEALDALNANVPVARCFPRNTAYCSLFGCEYAPICRALAGKQPSVPVGFVTRPVDPRIKLMNQKRLAL
jgi:hypothetical protein